MYSVVGNVRISVMSSFRAQAALGRVVTNLWGLETNEREDITGTTPHLRFFLLEACLKMEMRFQSQNQN